jgi:initiation factor 1A
MVKNLGGKNGKKVGRKFVSSHSAGGNKLRLVVDEDEIYACVMKVLGNGMCHVLCVDNKTRLCIIRSKFRGRGKRDNTLGMGTYVMVGKRSWETSIEDKLDKCDLVEVYTTNEVKKLKDSVSSVNWAMFKNLETLGIGGGGGDDKSDDNETFEFSNDQHNDDLENSILEQLGAGLGEVFLQKDDDVDTDDI